MRVALVSMETRMHRDAAGIRRVERVARNLAAAGHEVTVYCSKWWDGSYESWVYEDVTYRAVTVSPSPGWFAARLPSVLAIDRPDVIHTTPAVPLVAHAANLGGTLARSPLVVDWFGDEPAVESRLGDWLARTADLVVTPSELRRTRVRERGATEETARVIPESIDFDRIREVDPKSDVDVVFSHDLTKTANLQNTLLGLAELRGRDWSATVIGDGPERTAYEEQAADLRIDDRIAFVGACDREERIAFYRGAHVFVQTAFRAQFATELLWALAAGCVGVVEYQAESSAHELIETRPRSFRVTDPEGIADAIADAASMEQLTIDEDFAAFDHGAVTERYLDAYAELVGEYGLLG
jgi:glycosyltransferase involved in cell wall biosynthesis